MQTAVFLIEVKLHAHMVTCGRASDGTSGLHWVTRMRHVYKSIPNETRPPFFCFSFWVNISFPEYCAGICYVEDFEQFQYSLLFLKKSVWILLLISVLIWANKIAYKNFKFPD